MPQELVEGMYSRKRRPNWTDQECLFLAQLMQERKDIVRGRCSTGVSILDKRHAWEEIAHSINTVFPQMQRTGSDCNKKWENLLAKSREEIKRLRRQASEESLSLEQFSTVTQIVISVMNLSHTLQQDTKDALTSEVGEAQQNSYDDDEYYSTNENISEKLTEHDIPACSESSSCPSKRKMTLINMPKSLALEFSSHHASGMTASADQPDSSPPSVHCTALQERLDLEMSVLRRQEAVLKLQEEYYTMKIKMMKKQMEEPQLKD